VLRRHWLLIVVFTILAGAAAATWSYRRTPVYESSSTVIVNASGTSQRQPSISAETVDMNTHKTGADAFATAYLNHRMAQDRTQDARVRSLTAKLDKLPASITDQNPVIGNPGSSARQALEAREARTILNSQVRTHRTGLGQLAGRMMSPGGRLQPADLPGAPVSPNHPVDIGIGLIVGLVLAVGPAP